MGLLMMTACTEQTLSPGPSTLELPGLMMVGAPTTADLTWGHVAQCAPLDFSCDEPRSSLTIMAVHCDGCMLLEDLTGVGFGEGATIPLTATTDGAITLVVQVRFDPTGETRTLNATSLGDRELGLEVGCKLLASNLATPGAIVDDQYLRDCDTVRLSSERVVVFPSIRTLRRPRSFPFCPDGSVCQGIDAPYRSRSLLTISPAPVGWASSELYRPDQVGGDFAILPPYTRGELITVSVPLASGELATATVMGPKN